MSNQKLNDAFKLMRKHNLIARQNFSCCGGCASYEIADDMHKALDAGKPKSGGVYYHRQDTQDIEKHGYVYLGFGVGEYSNNQYQSDEDLGYAVVSILERVGLKTVWDGQESTRILVIVDPKYYYANKVKREEYAQSRDSNQARKEVMGTQDSFWSEPTSLESFTRMRNYAYSPDHLVEFYTKRYGF